MKNQIQVIDQRTVLEQDFKMYGTFEEPLFMAKDVAEWIEYDSGKVGQMLETIDDNEKLTTTIYRSGQNRKMWFLTEDGLYEVLMQSRKPIAKQFKSEVKKILKSLRTGKTKLVGMTEYQQMVAKTRVENTRIRKAQILERLANQYDGTYKQVLHAHATKELTGEYLLPLPKLEAKTYSATEIGDILGITANKVGTLTNRHSLKTDQYGAWFNDKAKGHSKEVQSFRYYESIIPAMRNILDLAQEGA